jgi:hypothetical protein
MYEASLPPVAAAEEEDAAAAAAALKPRRPPLTGWLLKRKKTGASRMLRATNRRFFTLDYDGHIIYYSHTESKKKSSRPIPLDRILRVEPVCIGVADSFDEDDDMPTGPKPPEPTPPAGWQTQYVESEGMWFYFNDSGVAQWEAPAGTVFASTNGDTPAASSSKLKRGESNVSNTSRASRFSSLSSRLRLPTFRRKREQHGFAICFVEPPDSKMECICASKDEADTWIKALEFEMKSSPGPLAEPRREGGDVEDASTDGGSDSDDGAERPRDARKGEAEASSSDDD